MWGMQLGRASLNGPCEEQNNVINLEAYEILVPLDPTWLLLQDTRERILKHQGLNLELWYESGGNSTNYNFESSWT